MKNLIILQFRKSRLPFLVMAGAVLLSAPAALLFRPSSMTGAESVNIAMLFWALAGLPLALMMTEPPLRVNFSDAKLSTEHVWPARFGAGGENPGAIPFGSEGDFRPFLFWVPPQRVSAEASRTFFKNWPV